MCFDESTDSVESGNVPGEGDSEAKNASEEWNCPACTLVNPTSSQICQLCDTEKPSDGRSKASRISKEWTCQQCTFVNKGLTVVCEICGSFAPTSSSEKYKQVN